MNSTYFCWQRRLASHPAILPLNIQRVDAELKVQSLKWWQTASHRAKKATTRNLSSLLRHTPITHSSLRYCQSKRPPHLLETVAATVTSSPPQPCISVLRPHESPALHCLTVGTVAYSTHYRTLRLQGETAPQDRRVPHCLAISCIYRMSNDWPC